MASHTDYQAPIHIANDVYIKPTYFVIKPQFSGFGKARSLKQVENEKNLKDNKKKADLSKKATSNLRNSINWLIHSAKFKRVWSKRDNKAFWFKVNFITLTIPPQAFGVVSEKEFQKCLNTWLVYARKYFYLHNYVWKIEAHADSRLHIHITTDTFINYRKLRDSWNRILASNELLEAHFDRFGNYDPNSSDVHAIHKVNKIAAYMCEYMIKKPNLPEGYKGRIWSCSYSLSQKNKCHVELEPRYNKRDYSFLNNPAIRYKEILSKPDYMGNSKKISDMYLVNELAWQMHMTGGIKDAYDCHIKNIRDATPVSPQSYRQIDFLKFKDINEVQDLPIRLVVPDVSKPVDSIGAWSLFQGLT